GGVEPRARRRARARRALPRARGAEPRRRANRSGCLMSDPYARPTDPAKRRSAALTDGVDRAPARAMLKAIGFDDDALARPVVGCDKTIPAGAMALARLDLPGLVLYNGSIAPGRFRGRDVTIQDVFEAVGAAAAGRMSNADVHELEGVACPGAGACGGQFTAN